MCHTLEKAYFLRLRMGFFCGRMLVLIVFLWIYINNSMYAQSEHYFSRLINALYTERYDNLGIMPVFCSVQKVDSIFQNSQYFLEIEDNSDLFIFGNDNLIKQGKTYYFKTNKCLYTKDCADYIEITLFFSADTVSHLKIANAATHWHIASLHEQLSKNCQMDSVFTKYERTTQFCAYVCPLDGLSVGCYTMPTNINQWAEYPKEGNHIYLFPPCSMAHYLKTYLPIKTRNY